MFKTLTLLIISATFLIGCTNTNKNNKPLPSQVLTINNINTKPVSEKALTDSARLLKHLDILVIPKFPFDTETSSPEIKTLNLSNFKHKTLVALPVKLRRREIGGCIIDNYDDNRVPSTFDLVDSAHQAKWILIAMKSQ